MITHIVVTLVMENYFMYTKESKDLGLQYRNFIEQGLNNNSTKSAIVKLVRMDKSSICKVSKNIRLRCINSWHI